MGKLCPPDRLRWSCRWLYLIGLGVLGAGVFFRFYRLDAKNCWYDETMVMMRLSGSYPRLVNAELRNIGLVSSADMLAHQHLRPDRGLADALLAIAVEDSKHPPLYYFVAHCWARWVGDSLSSLRMLSAIAGVVLLGCVYCLAAELFEDRRAAWLTTMLVAISPLHVLYAQEARQYSMWMALVCAASALLLRAMRLKTKRAWWFYTLALLAALYTHTLTGFVIVAHFIYILAIEWRTGLSATSDGMTVPGHTRLIPSSLRWWLASLLIVLVAFAPWGAIVFARFSALRYNTRWVTENVAPSTRLARWVLAIDAPFYDVNPADVLSGSLGVGSDLRQAVELVLVTFAAGCLILLIRRAPRRQWMFIVAIIGTFVVGLAGPDLLLGGQRSLLPRFLFPLLLALQFAVAWALSDALAARQRWRRILGQVLTVGFIGMGLTSCAIASQAPTWWTKGPGLELAMARTLNVLPRPLVITELDGGDLPRLIAASHYFAPQVRILISPELGALAIWPGHTDLFAYNPGPSLLREVEAMGYRAVPIEGQKLMRLERATAEPPERGE